MAFTLHRLIFPSAVALFVLGGSGCDFGAAEDAFDQFGVVFQFDEINTIVAGAVVDASNGEFIDATASLSFQGPDAGAVIDAFSDSVNMLTVDEGTVVFGISNSVVPSASDPVELTILVEADGYFDRELSLLITEAGDTGFQANMTPMDLGSPFLSLRGTGIATSNAGNVQAGSGLSQPLSLGASAPAARADFSASAGTTPLAGDGSALQGPLTTEMRVFDGADGLGSLPSGVFDAGASGRLSVAMTAWFRLVDGAGRVAVDYMAPAGGSPAGPSASKASTACTDAGGTSLIFRSTETAFVSNVQAQGGSASADIWVYTLADAMNNLVGTIPVTLSGGAVSGEICLGGTAANIDPSLIGNESLGFFYTFAIDGGSTTSGTLDHTVTISNSNASANQVTFALTGPGFSESAIMTVSTGSSSGALSSLVGQGAAVNIVDGADYVLSATLSTGATNVVTISNPLSGSSTIAIPTASGLQTFDLTASLACNDPVNEKFEIRITDESLDAVSIFYREQFSGFLWTVLPRRVINSRTVTDSHIEVEAQLALRPSTNYQIRGTLADNSAEISPRTPGSGPWTVTMSASDIGVDCEER